MIWKLKWPFGNYLTSHKNQTKDIIHKSIYIYIYESFIFFNGTNLLTINNGFYFIGSPFFGLFILYF